MKLHLKLFKIAIVAITVLVLLCCNTIIGNADTTKTAEENAKFYGQHSDYGASVWGVNFLISVTYDNSSTSCYTAKEVYTSATMYPKHTFGEGDVIVAGFDESVDFGASTSRSIKPTKSSFWQIQNVILPTGTKKYYAYTGSPNKDFRYEFKEDGAFTFAVPNVYFAFIIHLFLLR